MGGQAKTEIGPGLRAGDEGSDLRTLEGGQAMTRLSTGTSLGLARRPDTVPGQGMQNPPGDTSMPLEKSTSLNREVTGSQPGAKANTSKSKTKRKTLTGQGQSIPPPTLTVVDIPHPDRGSPHHTAATDAKKTPEVEAMPGVGSDQTDLPTDTTDNYICTNYLSTIY